MLDVREPINKLSVSGKGEKVARFFEEFFNVGVISVLKMANFVDTPVLCLPKIGQFFVSQR